MGRNVEGLCMSLLYLHSNDKLIPTFLFDKLYCTLQGALIEMGDLLASCL